MSCSVTKERSRFVQVACVVIMSEFNAVLKNHLRKFPEISELKQEQESCIRSIVEGKDVLGILPTGFGKSIIFQLLPRVLKDTLKIDRATVIVITPLISIMRDQVQSLKEKGIKAVQLGNEDEKELKNNECDVEIVYGSAENFLQETWLKELRDGNLGKQVKAIVIDEVHSVSLWGQASSKKKRKQQPFREAFGRVKDIRSILLKLPLLALTASVKLNERTSLMNACGIINPIVVDVSPNKDNIYLDFEHITEEANSLEKLRWLTYIIKKEKQNTPQTIIFCTSFNDIANVLSYLLMHLKNDAFIDLEGTRFPLLGVYHSKTWDTQKLNTEKDFREDGIQRVVIATSALDMGINFPRVKYVVHYAPPPTVTELLQQAGRAGRNGQQAYSIMYGTNRKIAETNKDVKQLFTSETCLRVGLFSHFHESIVPKKPLHLCCSNCRKECKCGGEVCAAEELPYKGLQTTASQNVPFSVF